MQIEGKAAWITGAGSGIGRAIAIALAEKGVGHLTLCDIDREGLAASSRMLAKLGSAVSLKQLDVSDSANVERELEEADRLQGLDIVINNAGIVAGLPEYPETAAQRIAQLISINFTAVTVVTAIAARLMARRGGGVIINTASTAAFNPQLLDAPYRASKAGVVMLTRCCAELASQGVRVNCVAPGLTDTPILNKVGDGSSPPAWIEAARREKHMLSPAEVAAAFITLIEDDSKVGEVIQLTNVAR